MVKEDNTMTTNHRERFWCWWLSRYLYKTDRKRNGATIYVDIADAQFALDPESEAKLVRK